MNGERTVARIEPGPPIHWVGDGFRVRGYFAAEPALVEELSPFLLLDYHEPHVYPPTESRRRGVGPHPHRGFETVTLAFEGSVAHHDSAGNGGVIGPGDVQWMTAGSGVLHREYHEAEFARRGGRMHMIQLWVNLPKAHKMTAPRYQALLADDMGRATLPGDGGLVRVIAGELDGARGPAKTFSPVRLFDVRLRPGGRFDAALPASENVGVLVMAGALRAGGKTARENDLVVLAHDGERVAFEAQGETHAVVMAGEPIDEPVVQYGPFAMNTEAEIRQAITDFNAGRFGRLDD